MLADNQFLKVLGLKQVRQGVDFVLTTLEGPAGNPAASANKPPAAPAAEAKEPAQAAPNADPSTTKSAKGATEGGAAKEKPTSTGFTQEQLDDKSKEATQKYQAAINSAMKTARQYKNPNFDAQKFGEPVLRRLNEAAKPQGLELRLQANGTIIARPIAAGQPSAQPKAQAGTASEPDPSRPQPFTTNPRPGITRIGDKSEGPARLGAQPRPTAGTASEPDPSRPQPLTTNPRPGITRIGDRSEGPARPGAQAGRPADTQPDALNNRGGPRRAGAPIERVADIPQRDPLANRGGPRSAPPPIERGKSRSASPEKSRGPSESEKLLINLAKFADTISTTENGNPQVQQFLKELKVAQTLGDEIKSKGGLAALDPDSMTVKLFKQQTASLERKVIEIDRVRRKSA